MSSAAVLTAFGGWLDATARGQWVAQGPSPIVGGQTEGIANGPVIGAVKSVVADPLNANVLFAGTVNGGVWRTTNAQSANPTWTPLTDFNSSLSIGAVRFDPTDLTGQTLIAGVGRFSSDASNGGALAGLLRSTNGGTSWSEIDGGMVGRNITGVAQRGGVIVASVDYANTFTYANIGIFRSTDGGASFQQVSSVGGSGLPGGRAFDLSADPTNPNVLYTGIRDAGAADGVYKSSDAGATWGRVGSASMNALFGDGGSGQPNTVNIKIAVGTANNVFVGIENAGKLAGLFRSGDGGVSFTQLDTPQTIEGITSVGINPGGDNVNIGTPGTATKQGSTGDPGGQGSVHFSIVADPTNPSVCYVGGDRQPSQLNSSGNETGAFPNSIGANNYTGRLFQVDASKATGSQATPLTHPSTASNSAPHADSRALTFDATGNLIEGDDGGIYKRTNPSLNPLVPKGDWSSLNGNLQITEFHSLAYDHVSHVLIGGTQDVGTVEQQTKGGTTWRTVNQGDGGKVAVDYQGGNSVRYSSYTYLQNFTRRVVDSSNNVISTSFPTLTVNGGGGSLLSLDNNRQFYNPIAVNAQNHNLVIGTAQVYESSDGGNTLNKIPSSVRSDGFLSRFVSTIAAGNPDNPDVLYVGGYANSSVGAALFVRTTNGGTLNQAVNYPGGDPIGIAINAASYKTAYIEDPSAVYQTTDAGADFSNITGNLSDGVLRSIAFAHVDGTDVVLAGGDLGVYFTTDPTDASPAWTLLPGLPHAPVFSLSYDASDDVLSAGTLGRGAWILPNFSASVPEPASLAALVAPGLLLLRRSRKVK